MFISVYPPRQCMASIPQHVSHQCNRTHVIGPSGHFFRQAACKPIVVQQQHRTPCTGSTTHLACLWTMKFDVGLVANREPRPSDEATGHTAPRKSIIVDAIFLQLEGRNWSHQAIRVCRKECQVGRICKLSREGAIQAVSMEGKDIQFWKFRKCSGHLLVYGVAVQGQNFQRGEPS